LATGFAAGQIGFALLNITKSNIVVTNLMPASKVRSDSFAEL